MNSKIFVVAACLLLAACSNSTAVKRGAFQDGKISMSTQDGRGPRQADVTLAVLPLQNNTGDPAFDAIGPRLAEMITTRLATRPGLRVVERARLEQLFKENKLALSGAVDATTAVQLGKLLGANVMAFGGFSKLEGEASLNLRLVKVETGEIVGGALERGKNLGKLDEMADEAAQSLAAGITAK